MIVKRRFTFEAAHHLPQHPGKCRRPHGHSYRLYVSVERPVDAKSGLAVDFGDVKDIVRSEVIARVDHRDLNIILDNPTAERIVEWAWGLLVDRLDGLVELELWETENCAVIYRGA